MNKVIRTERGWGGHYILAHKCLFRRNTLLEYKDVKIVVSSVGLLFDEVLNKVEISTIGHDRYFETMAFHALENDTRYYDADVTKQYEFESNWCIDIKDADDLANIMHENVVTEITNKLLNE